MDKRSYFTELPLNDSETAEWENFIESKENRLIEINVKIDKYNLLVPILQQQMCRVQIRKISDRVLSCKPNVNTRVATKSDITKSSERQENSILSFLFWWTRL